MLEICVENYSKIIKKTPVLSDINYTFRGGNIYGLYGINGSGKTMLMRAIAGLIYPTSGKIKVNDRILGKDMDFPESIGVLIETPYFIPDYTGFVNIKLITQIKAVVGDEEIKKAIESVGLDYNDKRKVGKYSLGMKQRLGIAAAIVESPEILLLDEPFNAIDEDGIALIKDLIIEYKNKDAIIIISSHDIPELSELCDVLLKMDKGKLIDENLS